VTGGGRALTCARAADPGDRQGVSRFNPVRPALSWCGAVLSNSGMSLEVRLDDDAERVDRLLK
jgi:hypothetical protein